NPWLTAEVTRSSSSSASPSARSFGSIRTWSNSSRPLTRAETAPPPTVPSTWSWPSASVAFSTDSRSFPAFRTRSARLPRLLNTVNLSVRDGGKSSGPGEVCFGTILRDGSHSFHGSFARFFRFYQHTACLKHGHDLLNHRI